MGAHLKFVAPRFPQRVERRGPAGLPASRRAISAPWREAALIAGIALIGAVVEGLGWV